MTAPVLIFFVLAASSIVSSLLVILQRNVVHSAMALVATLFLMAIIFLTLEAPMVAALQILVYAGAIMVLFLFVIMLLNPLVSESRPMVWWFFGALAAMLLAIEFVALFLPVATESRALPEGFGSPGMLAQSLFTDFVLPFEIASIVLLVAIIGAVVLAKREI